MTAVNEIWLPVDVIFSSLEPFAEIEVHGTVELEISLLPNVIDGVRIVRVYDQDSRPRKSSQAVSRSELEKRAAKAERINLLQSAIAEASPEIKVICPVVRIKATFQDGKCQSIRVSRRDDVIAALGKS